MVYSKGNSSSRRKKKPGASDKTSGLQHDDSPSPIIKSDAALFQDEGYHRIINEIEDYAIFLLDPEGIIMTWNKGAQKIKGYSPEEIIGRNYRIFYPKEDKANRLPQQLLKEAATNGRVVYEGWRIRKDGKRFWGNITLTAIHREDGEVMGFLKVTKDLTDKKIAEDNYSNYVEELRQKSEELRKSEERYHKMVSEVVDYAIILLDKDGKILDWNKGAEKLKGYTAKEIIGKSFRMFYAKEDKEAKLPERLLGEAVKNGHVNHEGWRVRKDGTRFWGSVVITALHDDEGIIIGFTKVTRDLTQRKIAEDKLNIVAEELRQKNEELLKSEERYHMMIAEVQDYAIILLNEKGDIQNWNAGAQAIKGYKSKEVIGKNFKIFYTKEDCARKVPEGIMQEAIKNGKALHEGWRVKKDGSKFWGSVVMTALHDKQGKVIGFSKVTRDLTEKKKADDALKANAAQLDLKNKMLERLNEDISSFTYVASHDLKEPLRKIHIFASKLEDAESFTTKGREYMDKIKNSVIRMQKLIDDLLSYSYISNDKSRIEKIDLNEILRAVTTDLEISIHEKRAIVQFKSLPVLQGISFQFHQVFLNLISNALKFSKPDERPVIKISSRVIEGPDIPGENPSGNNRYFQITVSDNGIGFEPAFSAKIFEAFQRLHSKDAISGTGIGLAIVKKVVENHHGIIEAEGSPGVGATFHLYFPVPDGDKYQNRIS